MKKYGMTALFSLSLSMATVVAQESLPLYTVGDYEVYTLTDRSSDGNSSILIGATPEMLAETMPDGTYPTAVHAYLIKGPKGNILIDTGLGIHIHEQLSILGVNKEDPIDILLTHMHGDHIGGLMKEGQATFPQADLYIPVVENNYWLDKNIIAATPADRRGNFEAVDRIIDNYRVTLFDEKMEILPDITSLAAYGHTPGHMAYLIESQGERLLIWGDLAHAMVIQMPYPDVAVTYDVDPVTATQSRKEILRYVSRENIPVAGMHIPGTGIGRIEATGENSYRFVPIHP